MPRNITYEEGNLIIGKLVNIRDKQVEDAYLDYQWRIDEELATLDATTPLRMSYNSYLRLVEDELKRPVPWSKRFAIETHDGTLIGNCMYYDIDTIRKQTELGILIGDKNYWNKGYGTDAVTTICNYIFDSTDFKKIYLHTLIWNIRAQQSFSKCGFENILEVNKEGYDFLLMALTREKWETMNSPDQIVDH
jgi:RimJ/RimL family protein N-acetyltransferase